MDNKTVEEQAENINENINENTNENVNENTNENVNEVARNASQNVETARMKSEDSVTQAEEAKKREARKQRLKEARNIRFTVGETDHTEPIPLTNFPETISSTAISTPTRLVRDIKSSIELELLEEVDLEEEQCKEEVKEEEEKELEEEDPDKLLTYESDVDSDEDKKRESVKGGDSVNAKTQFLDTFEIPSFGDISEDDDELLVRLKSRISDMLSDQLERVTDPGKFVDPVTGESLPSKSNESSESVKESEEESSSSSDGLLDFESYISLRTEQKQEPLDLLGQFEAEIVVAESKVDVKKPPKTVHIAKHIAKDFLIELIDMAVTYAENLKQDLAFNRNIDKTRLYAKLLEVYNSYNVEKSANDYLNSKLYEYYKRVRNERAYSKLSPEQHEKEYARYREILLRLDFNLHLANEAKKKCAFLISSVMMDISYAQNIANSSEEVLANKMMQVLGSKSEYLNRITERELRLMRDKRDEISDSRLSLITTMHVLARITEQIHKLQQINENISMDDFITLQNQCIALNKKIEERNYDLKKLRFHYHSELHMTQHCREKTQAVSYKLKSKELKLKSTLDLQQALRHALYKAKMDCANMRKQHSDLAFQGGLLVMPALMHDYDKTVELVNEKRLVVNELKENLAHLNSQISHYELSVSHSNSI